jgi:hypothetical protein
MGRHGPSWIGGNDLVVCAMSLLLPDDRLRERAAIAADQLAPLANGLAAELAPAYERELFVPREKAVLSRDGGRCLLDGAMLDFDPFSPHQHRCPVCGKVYSGEAHYRNWIYRYHLWLAERAVHAALFHSLEVAGPSGSYFSVGAAGSFASAILVCYADQYLLYPNSDNVLGPTRPFFSTYLESIWLLNLCIAVDLLERRDRRTRPLGARVRDRIIEPSASLIASYDEGASNRQVWNAAALVAANRLLDRNELVERALFGRGGIANHIEEGLLVDGTWYEGENYHLFAHRGLWYGVTMAEAAGLSFPSPLLDRFQEGFATPFLSSLPDMTLPSRRDSQYAISLRQPRFAELCELGLAREADEGDIRLRNVLRRLYTDDVPRRDTGRAQSTADVERNLPGTRLTRADLGWRSLLFARPKLPPLDSAPLGSVNLGAQGLAVFRRANERVYVALDYGCSGGGHGHPDRLNVLLSEGETRWLDDMGTGSYVDPSLHWYRSTLAHNAPLFNGQEQQRVDGELLAFEELGEAGWVSARALELSPGVAAMRTLVVMDDYVLDELAWQWMRPGVMDLPIHVDLASLKIRRFVPDEELRLREADPPLADTMQALADVSVRWLAARSAARLTARDGDRTLHGVLMSSSNAVIYHATAPGAPGRGRRPLLILRVATAGETAWVRTVWSWSDAVETTWVDPDDATTVERRDGSHDRHFQTVANYRVKRVTPSGSRTYDLGGRAPLSRRKRRARADAASVLRAELLVGRAASFELGEGEYRRSEESWEDAGRPSARLELLYVPNELLIDVVVRKSGDFTFVSGGAVNPYDNESPDINGDGVQLYLADDSGASAWVLVPELDGEGLVRARAIDGWPTPRQIITTWKRVEGGYVIQVRLPVAPSPNAEFQLGVAINEKPPGRERRRGQLVLGGARGEFVYLRGDREDRGSLPRIVIAG